MFAIYKNGSVGFRNTSDNLYELKKNVEAISAVTFNPEEGFIQELNSRQKNSQHNNSYEALNSYKKMANVDISEPVYEVRDIMTRNMIYTDNQATLEDAYRLLKEHQIGQIPVVTFAKKILGLVSKKMILNLLMDDIENSKSILERKIEDIYLSEIITADPATDIRKVAKVMIDLKLDAIPIVDESDSILGIVSKTDIIKAVSHLPKLQLWS